MSVIIRLQNLPWSANALDIRQFFQGLSIPEGGVHIVGGEEGDAFIAFSTDEDARQAFGRNNGRIKEVQITLMLSSRTEMQRVIEAARAKSYAAFMPTPAPAPVVPLPAAVPAIIPAPVPEITTTKSGSKEREGKSEKRDKDKKRSSRSRSRDRKDRDRRDRRHRDRSRSRSRERRERRRRERSRSRGRTRSRDRDRKNRDRKQRSSPDVVFVREQKRVPEVWATNTNQNSNDGIPPAPQPPVLGSSFVAGNVVPNANAIIPNQALLNRANNFQNNFQSNNQSTRSRDTWSMPSSPNDNSQSSIGGNISSGNGPAQQFANRDNGRRFPRSNFSQHRDNDLNFQPAERAERDPLPNSCVKLQPFYGGYGDIRRFFQGSFISNVGIKFINDDFGQRTGLVYIQFGNPQSKFEAIRKNGVMLNGEKIQVAHLEDQEFELAVDRYRPGGSNSGAGGGGGGPGNFLSNIQNNQNEQNNQNNDEPVGSKFRNKNVGKYFQKQEVFEQAEPEIKVFSCLTVEDLPTYVKEQDILRMFSHRPLISLILTKRERGGHIAYVKFGSADEARKALEETPNHIVDGKAVTVRPCTDSDFETISQEHELAMEVKQPQVPPMLDTDCVQLTQVPLTASNVEIADFFTDVGVRPMKIHLINNRMGFTGQAFCEFNSVQEATEALKKDNCSFGPNHVIVEPLPRDEMLKIVQGTQQQIIGPPSLTPTPTPQPVMEKELPMMRPQMMSQDPRPQFFPRNNFDGVRGGGGGGGGMGGAGMGGGGMGGGPLGGGIGGGGMGSRFMRGPRPRFQNAVPNEDAPPGCTVYMDNVPYKAGTNEILDFFRGYDITDNVSRRYNPNNTPSAEAKIIFNSPEEAFRAVQEKSGERIWDRPIYLKQV